MFRATRLDLQAKVSLVLLAVIVPTFVVVTIAENAITRPLLENEMKQLGVSAGQTLADEIQDSRWLGSDKAGALIEGRMQEILYTQSNVALLRVFVAGETGERPKLLASSVEEPEGVDALVAEEYGVSLVPAALAETIQFSIVTDEDGSRLWRILVPILSRSKKVVGNVMVVVTLQLVDRIQTLLWRSTIIAAFVALVALFIGLRHFLRRTIENEKRLIAAENQNEQLTVQLHETQRQLMTTEKLAVMGQLTATFAHEIGTPLNAMSGHLQLLGIELSEPKTQERVSILRSQVEKIEKIVRGFLQSTAQPASQRQLVDLNRTVDQTLSIVGPRAESMGVRIEKRLERSLGPVRAVPLEIEQILLNLVNNSLDSLRDKARADPRAELRLDLVSRLEKRGGSTLAVIEVEDTGEGVPAEDMKNVWKPFYTTKRPGEGTGLGLTICQQLAKQNGAMIELESKWGSWTRVTVRLPYA